LNNRRRDALYELEKVLKEVSPLVDIVLVEGSRDVKALRRLGYSGAIEITNQVGVSDYDLLEIIAKRYDRVLVLTDFDREGISLNLHYSRILEREGIKVERGLRRAIGRLTAAIGVYEIEDLDNILDKIERTT
jgi:5S rRNA maturation endonuclease (ribonuclease M5)